MGERGIRVNRQPIPFGPASAPRTVTKRGHTKAAYLTQEQLARIMQNMRDGMEYNKACWDAGTSHTQFMRRIGREPDLLAEVTEIKQERRRQRAKVESRHERDDASGVHESSASD